MNTGNPKNGYPQACANTARLGVRVRVRVCGATSG